VTGSETVTSSETVTGGQTAAGGPAVWRKARPNVDEDNREFWDGLAGHRLLLWHCGKCGAWYWPKAYCREHPNEPFAAQMSWQPAAGTGRIFSANVHQWAFDPAFTDDVPFPFVLVELDEGPLISSMLTDRADDPVALIGRRVEVVFEDHLDLDDGFVLPKFRLL
jgi:uncharacterized OB-fold protein